MAGVGRCFGLAVGLGVRALGRDLGGSKQLAGSLDVARSNRSSKQAVVATWGRASKGVVCVRFERLSFIRSMTGIRHERAAQRDGSDFDSQSRFGANPTEASRHRGGLTREAEAHTAAKNTAWSSGLSGPGRRLLVRCSLDPDDA